MRKVVSRVSVSLITLVASGLFVACTLVEPLDEYSGGPAPAEDAGHDDADASPDASIAACARDEKICDGVCHSALDEQYGCGGASCSPCAFANATADGCDGAGKCRMGACVSGYADCNARSEDGCEVKLDDDPKHCGACEVACDAVLVNGSGTCTAGKCALTACTTGFEDCNKSAADGCEIDTQTDIAHCGGCASPCPDLGNTSLTCSLGACKVEGCKPGYLDCDLAGSTGCECGYPNAKTTCGAGAAAGACVFTTCSGTFADCNANLAQDGCEIDTALDAENCGACGFTCEGGACVAGRCQPKQIIGGQGNPGELVIDLDYAYWSNYGAGGINGSIYRVRKDGMNPTLIAGGADATQNSAWGIATDDSTSKVFWTTYSATSHVGSALKVGGSSSVPASTTGRLRGAALDGNYLYFANYEQNTIVRFDVTAASPVAETVASGAYVARPNAIAFDATSVYWVNEGTAGTPTAGGTPTSQSNSGSVVALTKASIGTATPVITTLITGQDKARGLAVDDTNVYWTNVGTAANAGLVARIAKDGSGAQTRTVLTSGLGTPRELALCQGTGCASDPYLYISTFAGGTILRVAKDAPAGTQATTIASQQKGPIGVAVDGKYVFWVNYGTSGTADGTVMKLVKQP